MTAQPYVNERTLTTLPAEVIMLGNVLVRAIRTNLAIPLAYHLLIPLRSRLLRCQNVELALPFLVGKLELGNAHVV